MPDFFLDRAKVVRENPSGVLPAASVRWKIHNCNVTALLCRIYRDGTVRYAARKSFDLACHFDYFKVDKTLI